MRVSCKDPITEVAHLKVLQGVMPLIYNALDCEHLPVQEKALKVVPHLSEILDYGTVQNILLVKVAVSEDALAIVLIRAHLLLDLVHSYSYPLSQSSNTGMLHSDGQNIGQGQFCVLYLDLLGS